MYQLDSFVEESKAKTYAYLFYPVGYSLVQSLFILLPELSLLWPEGMPSLESCVLSS